MRFFQILRRTTLADYILVIRIYYLLHLSKWYIEKYHLKDIIKWVSLGENVKERPLTNSEKTFASKIAHYTRTISRYVFFKSKCYDRALTVKKLLNEKNIPSAISMGVKSTDPNKLEAHAIIKCLDRCIIGGEIANQFTFVQSFI